MGLPTTHARALCYTPKDMFGQGITDVWVEQGLPKLGACLRNGTAPTITGFQLRSTLQDLIMELPTSQCPLTLPYKTYRHLATPTWLTNLWEFLNQQKQILCHPFTAPPLQCDNDAFLLELFVTAGYTKTPLRQLQLCCQWVDCSRISGLATGDGRRLQKSVWNGHAPYSLRPNAPLVGKPLAKCWKIWKDALDTCLLRTGKNPNARPGLQPRSVPC
jgi:hypothetical protein